MHRTARYPWRLIAAAVLALGLAGSSSPLPAEEPSTSPSPGAGTAAKGGAAAWDEQAEKSFCLGRGMGRALMTESEWQEHRQKMRALAPAERDRYRAEWHQKMRERATEKGLQMPDQPCPWCCAGGAGMGHGPGMRGRGAGGN
jgi:hypothetical protein